MNTLRYGGAPSKACWLFEHNGLQVGHYTLAVCQVRRAGCVDTVVFKCHCTSVRPILGTIVCGVHILIIATLL